jgi:hypothetical protein
MCCRRRCIDKEQRLRHTMEEDLTLTDEEREYIKACATAKKGTVLICRLCKTPIVLEHEEIGWIHEYGLNEQTCRPTTEQISEWAYKVYLYEKENRTVDDYLYAYNH